MSNAHLHGERTLGLWLLGVSGLLAILLLASATAAAGGAPGAEPAGSLACAAPVSGSALELGMPEPVELAWDPSPCLPKETPQDCRFTDPCTGQVFADSTCCPPGAFGSCLITSDPNRCITGVEAICLEPF